MKSKTTTTMSSPQRPLASAKERCVTPESPRRLPDAVKTGEYFRGLMTSPFGSNTKRDERIKQVWQNAQREGR